MRGVLANKRVDQVAELRVDDEVEAFGLQGTLAALNGTTMYVHRYDEATRQFSIAGFTREELQAVRDGRKHRLDTRKSGKTHSNVSSRAADLELIHGGLASLCVQRRRSGCTTTRSQA